MAYLLDTHIILWWLSDIKKITPKVRRIIEDKNNAIYISSVSFWEMAIKKSIGRLTYPTDILPILSQEGFLFLSIAPQEALSVGDLPPHHTDPFDRMLVMQAKLHDLVLITKDTQIMQYPVTALRG